MMKINFECKKCGSIFDCDVGDVGIDNNTFRPQFENDISCPKCGKCTIDEVMLTELGQGQLTEATFNFEPNETIYSEDDILVGLGSSGECQGCDSIQRLNDLGLCDSCSEKLDRDLIRQRDWTYSTLAFGVPPSNYEDLRQNIISLHGEKLELISPAKHSSSIQKHKKNSKRKRIKGLRKR